MLQQLLFVVEAAVVTVLCLLVLVGVRSRLGLPDRVFALLLGAFVLRVGVAIVVDSLGTFAGQFDFSNFDGALWQVAQGFRDGIVTAPLETAAASGGELFYLPYTVAYAPVYAVFGHHTLLVRIVFALVGTLLVCNVYRIGRRLHGHEAGLYAAVIAVIFPYWLYLSTIFYRDMLIMLVLSQVLYQLLGWKQSRNVTGVLSVGVLVIVSVMLRPENIIPLIAALGTAGYAFGLKGRPGLKTVGVGMIGVAGFEILRRIGIKGSSITVHGIAKQRDYLARGGGAYLEYIAFTDWLSVIWFAPVGATYFLLLPFPWQVHNVLALVALLQNVLLWYPVVFFSIVGIACVAPRRPLPVLVLVSFVLAGVFSYGIIEGNMGPVLRHRSQFQFPLVVLAGIGVAEKIGLVMSTDGVPTTSQS